MIRYMGGSDSRAIRTARRTTPRASRSSHELIEVVTAESSAPGERHEALADHVGEIAVQAWRGFPEEPETETSGVGWILAVEWVPYQRSSFVTPAFPGYVSGHSTFSRAAAVLLTAFTGDPYFPGGLTEWTVPQGELLHEEGPTVATTIQWATYADAADQAGISRLYMGIHTPEDDFQGRRIGAACGQEAWVLAEQYFATAVRRGSSPPNTSHCKDFSSPLQSPGRAGSEGGRLTSGESDIRMHIRRSTALAMGAASVTGDGCVQPCRSAPPPSRRAPRGRRWRRLRRSACPGTTTRKSAGPSGTSRRSRRRSRPAAARTSRTTPSRRPRRRPPTSRT